MTANNARHPNREAARFHERRGDALDALVRLTSAVALLVGCQSGTPPGAEVPAPSGSAGSPASGNGSGGAAAGVGGGNTAGGATTPTCNEPTPGNAPLRRLTRFEYNNTVRDLLFDTTHAADALPPELKGNGFNNDAASLTTSRVLVDGYRAVAQVLAAGVVSNTATLSKVTGCDPAPANEDVCAASFVSNFGKKAFRRPLTEAETASFLGVYRGAKQGGSHVDGVKAVLELTLQSPQFLYRVERGVPAGGSGGVRRPTSLEMATRLSYLLWGSVPDPALLDVAASSGLDSKEQVLAQAKRMLDDPRARDVVRHFTNTLYGIGGLDALERDQALFPTYTRGLGALFRQETERFIDHVVWEGAGNFGSLFDASFTFVNGPLAAFYGLTGVAGDEFRRVDVDPSRRSGLLTHASILASTTPGSRNNPIVRGKFIYEELFCLHVPSPPVGLTVKEPPADPTRTTRERFAAHREVEPCKSCHVMLDPIGFGLEHFDGVGLWRDTENGKPVDASGVLPVVDVQGPFDGAVELSRKIASSEEARSCFSDKWFAFAFGRTPGDGDACARGQLDAAFRESGGNVKALLLAATQTDAFLYLPPATP